MMKEEREIEYVVFKMLENIQQFADILLRKSDDLKNTRKML